MCGQPPSAARLVWGRALLTVQASKGSASISPLGPDSAPQSNLARISADPAHIPGTPPYPPTARAPFGTLAKLTISANPACGVLLILGSYSRQVTTHFGSAADNTGFNAQFSVTARFFILARRMQYLSRLSHSR
jgi:hypothetical protein